MTLNVSEFTISGMKITKDEILEYFGSPSKLARLLEIHPQAVYQWRKIPERHCYKIELLSRGKFKFRDLMKVNFKEEFYPEPTKSRSASCSQKG